MRVGLERGLSAAEAASAARADEVRAENPLDNAAPRLLEAIRLYDEPAVQTVLDDALAGFALEAVVQGLIVPVLQRVGQEWENGAMTISHEHFASNVIRGRLLALARLWGRGGGPLAVIACPPGEAHDISLLAFGLLLRSYGWRILFLGADTPTPTLAQAVESTSPAAVVLASFDSARIDQELPALRRLARRAPLALGGPGATEAICARIGARRLAGDVVAAAEQVARTAFPRTALVIGGNPGAA
jgi:methanogenic corrinoid protein MtbC1